MSLHRPLCSLACMLALSLAGCHSHRSYPYRTGGYHNPYQQPTYISQGPPPMYQGGPAYPGAMYPGEVHPGGVPMMADPGLGPGYGQPTPVYPGQGATRPGDPNLGNSNTNPGNPYYQRGATNPTNPPRSSDTQNPKVPDYNGPAPFERDTSQKNPSYDQDPPPFGANNPVPPVNPTVQNPPPNNFENGPLAPPPGTNVNQFPPPAEEPFPATPPPAGDDEVPFGSGDSFKSSDDSFGGDTFQQDSRSTPPRKEAPPNVLANPSFPSEPNQIAFEQSGTDQEPFSGEAAPFSGEPEPFQGDPKPFEGDSAIPKPGQPDPYAYDTKGYRWLRGVVDFDPDQKEWFIMYDLTPDGADKFGGEMTLVEGGSQKIALLKPGKVVLVEGFVDETTLDKQNKPSYRVRNLAILKPRN